MNTGVVLSLPFEGRWLTQNSPARRVPSHGTDLMGGRYAIDFVGVADGRRTANRRDWRTVVATEPPERFVAFGRPILAPADGVVARVHDGEVDHEARRSQLALVPYAVSQPSRLRRGVAGLAGNHIVIALRDSGAFVVLAHLKKGSLRVDEGDEVTTGQAIGECGNSGNSTQPHVHVQVMDLLDAATAQGLPMSFRRFREWPRGARQAQLREVGLPQERAVVEPIPAHVAT
jgi:hypothetical protein